MSIICCNIFFYLKLYFFLLTLKEIKTFHGLLKVFARQGTQPDHMMGEMSVPLGPCPSPCWHAFIGPPDLPLILS